MHAIKFKSLLTPEGLIAHAAGPLGGRRHDWTLYIRSSVDEQLKEVLLIEGRQLYFYGYSGYNRRAWMEIPIEGTNLNAEEQARNKSMS